MSFRLRKNILLSTKSYPRISLISGTGLSGLASLFKGERQLMKILWVSVTGYMEKTFFHTRRAKCPCAEIIIEEGWVL